MQKHEGVRMRGGATYNVTQGRERMGMGAGRVGTVMRMGMGTRWGLGVAAQGRQKWVGGRGIYVGRIGFGLVKRT